MSYDSDEESIADTTSPAANPAAASLSSPSNGQPEAPNTTSHNNNNNNNSSHMTHHQALVQHQLTAPPPPPSGASLTGLYNGQHQYYPNQMTTHDFKPQYLADWYSHGMTSLGNVSRYDPASVSKHPHHVSAALPTPPSTGHSPIQSLSNHLHLLPSTTTAYT